MSDYAFWNCPRRDITDFPRAIEIDHHSGPRIIAMVDGQTPRETVYDYIRSTHHFLQDDNHMVDYSPEWAVAIRYNEKSPRPILKAWWGFYDVGDLWFSVRFRIVSPETFDRDIEHNLSAIPRYREQALANRNTVRGRKAYLHHVGLIQNIENRVRWFLKRKQDFMAGDRFDHLAFRAKYEPEYLARHKT